ncbi:MAG: MlaD family protein [Campylobacterota bacterium]|nr:MlaD family protein [Campylobacterota bacterium]
MYSRVNYTIVGLFVLLFSVGLSWFGFWLAKYDLQEEYSLYRVEMKESVAGLSKDSNVQLHGVTIGRVSDIRINPSNIEVIEILLEIKKSIPIKEDMIASTQMLGVTGLLSIEIDGGTNEAQTLLPTDTYTPLIASKPSSLSKLANNLGGLSEKLEKLLSDTHIESMGKILEHTEVVTLKAIGIEEKASLTLEEVDLTLKAFRVSLDSLKSRLTEATENFKQMQKDFSQIKAVSVPTIENLMQTSTNFNRATLKFEKSLDRGDYSLKKILEPILVDVHILSTQLNTMSRDLGDNPSSLLFKSRESRKGPGE